MNLQSASTQTPISTDVRSEAATRLHGGLLALARVFWGAVVVLTLGMFVASLPVYFVQLEQLSPSTDLGLPANFFNLGLPVNFLAIYFLAVTIASAMVYFTVAGVVVWRKSDDWMALLVAFMLVQLGASNLLGYVGFAFPVGGELAAFLDFLTGVSYSLAFSLFPDGRLVPHWTRWLLISFFTWTALSDFTPLNTWDSVPVLSGLAVAGVILSLVVAQIYRYRHVSSPVQRQQTRWVVFGISVAFLARVTFALCALILPSFAQSTLFSWLYIFLVPYIFLLLPLSIGIAILRYRLWDLDIIINRTLVYGVLTVSIIAFYILVVVGLGALLQAQGNLGISLMATGLIAVLFHPLRSRLQRVVNRLMYGERDDPYRVLTHLGSRLEASLAPEAVLATIVETVALALKLPYAAITVREENTLTPAVSFGVLREGEGLVRLPLVAQHELVGELVLAPRAPGEAFTPADQRLLEDLSRQIGVAVYAVRLTADLQRLTVDLQRSRERLVTAREEERRRLRRDLHDGLGPQLASLTLKLETARNRLAHDPLADTLLSDLAQRTQATVADIRRLVYALRPPALDELGLLSALRELTLQSSDQAAMHLDAPDCLPELPAAVEVAVYRIAQEALTNVVRHAHAQHCDIQLALDEKEGLLSLCIQDDGQGLLASRGVGVGLVSMRERAEELGGTWTIEQVPTGGTHVLARLPYVRSETADALVVSPTAVSQEEV